MLPQRIPTMSNTEKKPVKECTRNPVYAGLYEWQDPLNTKVEIFVDGSAEIIQGDQKIVLDRFGFFRDVFSVFEAAIDAMAESDFKDKLFVNSLGSSRAWPRGDWND